MPSFSRQFPNARTLLIFEAALRLGSFTASAKEFNVTQPSVSRSIAQLETELGAVLFVRSPTGLSPTPEGRLLYSAVKSGFEEIAVAIQKIGERRSAKPVVTLSMLSATISYWLVPRLSKFNALFPSVDIRFELITGSLQGGAENVDLAERMIDRDDVRYKWWAFAPEVIFPVCSPGYLAAHGMLDDSPSGEGHSFLHFASADYPWMKFWDAAAKGKGSAAKTIEFTDYAAILQAAVNGEGITLGWIGVISSLLMQGRLVPASNRRIETGKIYGLVAPRLRPIRPIIEDICAWLLEQMGQELDEVNTLFPFNYSNAEVIALMSSTKV
ncbi:LysR family transcriptional regulator [Pararhizobium gei]|uniref:LysR family transcriptional regulator n=1 Tax=Pararhizobium gei TaxID=1395951 RepID=UPI0023DC67A9|nr:LysR family transcriptional regulator [Rhizobium gei]